MEHHEISFRTGVTRRSRERTSLRRTPRVEAAMAIDVMPSEGVLLTRR